MIHYKAKMTVSGYIVEGVADRIRVCYTPEKVSVFCLEGSNDYEFELTDRGDQYDISEFWCEKFSLRV